MTLKELINYRQNCLLCKKKMVLKNKELAGVSVRLNKDGLRVKLNDDGSGYSKNWFAQFNYDGTYIRGSNGPWSIYVQPMIITKTCPNCETLHQRPIDKILIHKPRSVGTTTLINSPPYSSLDNVKKLACTYSFTLHSENNKFEGKMQYEFIGFSNDEEFYHISTDFAEDNSTVFHSKFHKKIGDMMSLRLPAINTSNINNHQQLISKIRMYNIFS